MDEARRKAAQRKLDDAVEQFFRDMGWAPETLLTSWILVGFQTGFDDGGNQTSGYAVVHMGGGQPDHVAIGLLECGKDMLRGVGWRSADE